jgi:hypothetical protein
MKIGGKRTHHRVHGGHREVYDAQRREVDVYVLVDSACIVVDFGGE